MLCMNCAYIYLYKYSVKNDFQENHPLHMHCYSVETTHTATVPLLSTNHGLNRCHQYNIHPHLQAKVRQLSFCACDCFFFFLYGVTSRFLYMATH